MTREAAIETALAARFAEAFARALGEEHRDADPLIRAANDPKFGDFQCNAAMGLARAAKRKPRDLAEAIVAALVLDDLCEQVEIAGPGFINLTLRRDAVAEAAAAWMVDPRGGTPELEPRPRVVIDYSSPNVAKEMHVGHLRPTIIGDALARVLEACGCDLIRKNHLGDWGTQFGMLIEHLLDTGEAADQTRGEPGGDWAIGDLDRFYREAKRRFDDDPDFAARARRRVVALQSGDATALAAWRRLREESQRHFDAVYDQLEVTLTREHVHPESAYNPMLPEVVAELDAAGQLHDSDGAKVVFPEGFENRDGEPLGMIVRKGDGGFLYATTDLAAARHRLDELNADRLIYVTDARQSQHFAMVFQTIRQAGWAPEHVRLDHVPFGMVLGPDRKPFKTREGGTVRLIDLIEEAKRRADAVIAQKNPDLPAEERAKVAAAVGVGAMKYADLSVDRVKDYVFDWSRMLAFEGNTAPYLQNAYVRIQSIFRKGGIDPASLDPAALDPADPAERTLVLTLLRFGATVASVAESLEPHRLCNWLFDTATAYHKFYEACPVLAAGEPTRTSRLVLCQATAIGLRRGLDLLGIPVIDRM